MPNSSRSAEIVRVGEKEREAINRRLWVIEHGSIYSQWIAQAHELITRFAPTEATATVDQANIYYNPEGASVPPTVDPAEAAANAKYQAATNALDNPSDLNANVIRAEIDKIHDLPEAEAA